MFESPTYRGFLLTLAKRFLRLGKHFGRSIRIRKFSETRKHQSASLITTTPKTSVTQFLSHDPTYCTTLWKVTWYVTNLQTGTTIQSVSGIRCLTLRWTDRS